MKNRIESKWWVSPDNYVDEVLGKINFPENIEFLDTTLRDGEQQPGVILTQQEKVDIAVALDKAGVQRIEAGTPAVLKADELAIKEISSLGLDADIYCFVRNMKADIDLAAECGVDGVLAEIVGSQHMLEVGQGWTIEEAIEKAVVATKYAHEKGLKVTFFPADSSRSDIDFLLKLVGEVYEHGHIDSLALVDTMGVFSPEAAAYRVKTLKKHFPDLPIECHFHNDFGVGVAATIAGLQAGAEVAHVTVGGIGERSGNVSFEEVALSLEALYGVDTGIDTTQLKSLAEIVEEKTRHKFSPRKPIVGDDIFAWETGLPSNLWMNVKDVDPLIMLPYHPSLTGHKMPHLLLSKKSGMVNLNVWLEKVGVEILDLERKKELLNVVKEYSLEHHKTLTEEEFRQILEEFNK